MARLLFRDLVHTIRGPAWWILDDSYSIVPLKADSMNASTQALILFFAVLIVGFLAWIVLRFFQRRIRAARPDVLPVVDGSTPSFRYAAQFVKVIEKEIQEKTQEKRFPRFETPGVTSSTFIPRRRWTWGGAENIVTKLLRRETCFAGARAFNRCIAQEKFRNFSLQQEYDLYDPGFRQLPWPLSHLATKIVEIVAAQGIVFARSERGGCAAFCRATNKRLCFLNLASDEIVLSIFYNKTTKSIVTASIYLRDPYQRLRCRTTSIEKIRCNRPGAGFQVFETENLAKPGFVEFDDEDTGVMFTYDAVQRIYKAFDMNYKVLYSFPSDNVQDIKPCPETLLIIYSHESGVVPLEIRSIWTGEVLKSFKYHLKPNKEVEFIEQFNEKLLVKQGGEDLQILDLRTEKLMAVDQRQFRTPSTFIRLHNSERFLTVRDATATVWNLRGEALASYDDPHPWSPSCASDNDAFYITKNRDLVISFCKPPRPAQCGSDAGASGAPANAMGSIKVNNILTGECLAKVGMELEDVSRAAEPSWRRALGDVTSVFYDEDRNEIYTGTQDGFIHVWGN